MRPPLPLLSLPFFLYGGKIEKNSSLKFQIYIILLRVCVCAEEVRQGKVRCIKREVLYKFMLKF